MNRIQLQKKLAVNMYNFLLTVVTIVEIQVGYETHSFTRYKLKNINDAVHD